MWNVNEELKLFEEYKLVFIGCFAQLSVLNCMIIMITLWNIYEEHKLFEEYENVFKRKNKLLKLENVFEIYKKQLYF